MAEDSALRELPAKYVEWRIEKFFELPTEVNYKIDSHSFSFSHAKWFLRIRPNGQVAYKSSGWIGLYLIKEDSAGEEHSVGYRIGIKKVDGSELKALYMCYTFKVGDSGYGWTTVVKRSTLVKNDLSLDGSLVVFCSIHMLNGQVASPTVETASQTQSAEGIATLSDNFKDLYFQRRFTDVTITVKSREFLVHRFVLASRSTVFAAMFDNDMEEKKSGRLEIADCDPNVFEQFLLFLYTGKLDVVTSGNAVELYTIADKYDIQELKEECARCMVRELSIDSFCDVLHLAEIQNEVDLLKSTTDFFINHADNILPTAKWKLFLEENPSMGNDLFMKLLKFRKSYV